MLQVFGVPTTNGGDGTVAGVYPSSVVSWDQVEMWVWEWWSGLFGESGEGW